MFNASMTFYYYYYYEIRLLIENAKYHISKINYPFILLLAFLTEVNTTWLIKHIDTTTIL
jgi:hypothetical protein